MKRSQAIKALLNAKTHRDLADLYTSDMEVQLNVAQDGGERVDGEYKGKSWHGWSDGITTWKSFRMPLNAKSDPEENDTEIKFDIDAHTEGIGLTGWDWRNRCSRWVAYDFDAITGHSEKHNKKLSESELRRVQEAVQDIPWVTVRASTGGKGLHLYVMLATPVPTKNHNEHAALARAILGLLASLTAFDFQTKVDVCGGNMWVWHRKMTASNNGLALLKQGTPLSDVPENWKDHLTVVRCINRKVVPSFISNQEDVNDIERMFDEIAGLKSRIPLDSEHQKLIKFLNETNSHSWWDQDNHMLVTHTKYLMTAHKELSLKGIFNTTSPGTEDEQNCFLFPIRHGGWSVRRYTPGVAEANTWTQDGNGWTRCYFNTEPDLQTVSRNLNGIEHKSGGFVFRESEVALKALESMGIHAKLPNWIMTRQAHIKEMKDGRILMELNKEDNDRTHEMTDWLLDKGKWSQIFNRSKRTQVEPEIGNYDDVVRHLINESNEDSGWVMKTDKQWRVEPLTHITKYLMSLSLNAKEVNTVLGSCVSRPWKIVCRPFEAEILGDREWNRNAPQIAFPPSTRDNLDYPTWLKVLKHIGEGLDVSIKNNPWCKANAILTGADYLKCWIASLFQEPMEPLPYLFFYGPQNSGKSIFHEAISLLMTSGVQRADAALINPQGFNAELENAVLCVTEETDMRKERKAYERIKDWVTSKQLPIHRKNSTPYTVMNTTHWVQCANDHQACPILPGDSRITMIHVDSLKPEDLIPKKELIPMLLKEAPDFLATLLNLDLPPSGDRLNVPVIETGEKIAVQNSNRSYLEVFLEECCYYVPGSIVTVADFHAKFLEWLDADQVKFWSKQRIGKELPSKYPKGRSRSNNQVIIGNVSFTEPTADMEQKPRLQLVGVHLEPALDEAKNDNGQQPV